MQFTSLSFIFVFILSLIFLFLPTTPNCGIYLSLPVQFEIPCSIEWIDSFSFVSNSKTLFKRSSWPYKIFTILYCLLYFASPIFWHFVCILISLYAYDINVSILVLSWISSASLIAVLSGTKIRPEPVITWVDK